MSQSETQLAQLSEHLQAAPKAPPQMESEHLET